MRTYLLPFVSARHPSPRMDFVRGVRFRVLKWALCLSGAPAFVLMLVAALAVLMLFAVPMLFAAIADFSFRPRKNV